jgi:hypothetical protein
MNDGGNLASDAKICEVGDRYGDAKVLAPYREASPLLAQQMIVSLGANKESQRWKPQAMPIGAFIAKLCRHEVGAKDGPSYVLGDMVPGRRLKTAVKALYAVGLDMDTGTSIAQIEEALLGLGCLAVRYSTHSHLKSVTEFKRDRLTKWADKDADGADFEEDEVLRRFLREVEKWDEEIVATAIYKGDEHQDRGIMAIVEHKAMPKHRIVVPFATPFEIADQPGTQADAMKRWGKIPTALAQKLGVPLDESCLDPSRLFYFPRHDKGAPFDVSLIGGPLFDWTTLVLDDPFEAEIAKLSKGQSKSQTTAGRDLGRWSMKRGHGFQIVQVIEEHCPDHLRNQTASGWEITCPFDEEHSNPGDPDDRACMAVNAGDGPSEWFSVRCLHETCKPKTSLDMVGKMVEDGWFAREVLDDESYNAVVDGAPGGGGGTDPLALADALNADATPDAINAVIEAIAFRPLDPARRLALKKKLMARLEIGARDADSLLRSAPNASDEATETDPSWLARLGRERGGDFSLPEGFHLAAQSGAPWICQKGEPVVTPIHLVGAVTYVDRDDAQGLQVDVRRADGTWTAVDFKSGQLEHPGEVLGTLRNAGMATAPDGGRTVMKWLLGSYQQGAKVVHRPGFREGGFIAPTGEVIGVEGVQLDRSTRLGCEHRKGTLEGWIAGAQGVFGLDGAHALHAGILMGWAGAVAGYLGDEPLAYSFEGPPNSGKSSAQELAAAHWASPKVGEGLFTVSNSTEAARELALSRGSGTLTAFDEIKHLPPQVQADLVFLNQGGQGKQRARMKGGEMTAAPGHNWIGGALIVSAETGFADRLAAGNVVQLGGLGRRIATISTIAAPKYERNSREWGHVRSTLGNFGWSGPAFVRALLEIDRHRVREKLDGLITALIDRTDEAKRSPAVASAARMIATLELAAAVGVKAGLVPDWFDEEALCDHLWASVMASNIAPTDPAERAADILIDTLIARIGTTIVNYNGREFASREVAGYHSAEVPPTRADGKSAMPRPVYVIRAASIRDLSGGAADPGEVRRVLEKRGALVRKPGGKGRTWNGFPGLGKTEYVVLLESEIGEPTCEARTGEWQGEPADDVPPNQVAA